ncbi:hypothetical protein FKX85_07525 [Echinicola soli]|uniref:Lipocalin-like domain-containing protein n=1 Tax=Echinicola soli TaxID=2591634 RepID=A0A514CGE6_9BACT|nr:hypothetical protein [Echinicola soli]QDH78893.1 hypothetical protein FKX85_07525 [Echinicola soli]
MRKLLLILGLVFIGQVAFCQELDTALLTGQWQLKHYDAIEEIRQSDRYVNATPQVREGMDRKIDRLMENTFYHFTGRDSLFFTDLRNGSVVERKASYALRDSLLTITEIGAKRDKRAKILELDVRQLVLVPLVNGSEKKGRMVFERVEP